MSSSQSPTPTPDDSSDSSNSPNSPNSNYIITDIAIGISILVVAIIIYIGRLLYKRRRKRYFKDNSEISMVDMELVPPPKKTAADHLEEIKEKIFVPLKMNSPKHSFEHSSILPTLNERPSLSSTRSSNSSNKKVEQKEGTLNPSKSSKDSSIHSLRHNSKHSSRYSSKYGSKHNSRYSSKYGSKYGSKHNSRYGSKYGSRVGSGAGSGASSTRLGSLPPPPPPSPLDFQDDDSIENEPIPMQLLDVLLSKTFPESPSESSSSHISSIDPQPRSKKVSSQISINSEQSFPRSSVSSHKDSSRLLSPSPRGRLNPKRPDRNSITSVHFISDGKMHDRYKETNDYTNFQPIQNTQNFSKVKTVIEDDDEVIL